MMKKNYSILMMLFICVSTLTAAQLKQKITPKDLGYTESADIFSFDIDENTLGLTVSYIKDGQYLNDFWVYDLNTSQAFDVVYHDSLLSTSEMLWDYHSDYSYYGFRNFLRDGNFVYTIVKYSQSDGKLEDGFHLLSANLVSKQQTVQFLGRSCNAKIGFIKSNEANFIVESGGCGAPFKLLAFTDSSWNEVWKIEDFGWVDLYYYDLKSPFYHNGKIYLSAQNQLYVFNTADYEVDTIIQDTRDVNGVEEECISLATQYFADGDDVYVVYKDVKVIYFYVIYFANNYEGYTRIWKTDGTSSGTQLFSRMEKEEEMTGTLFNSKLFKMNDRLLWLGDVDSSRRFEIFEVKENSLKSLGELSYLEDLSYLTYNSRDVLNRNIFYQQVLPVRFEEQDVLPLFQLTEKPSNDKASYLSLMTLEGDQIKLYADNYQLSNVGIDEDGYTWNVYDVRVSNLAEKLVVSRFSEKMKDSTYSYGLDFLIANDYNIMEFDTIDIGYDNPAGFSFSFKVDDELFFNYPDKENGNLIIWSLNAEEVTGLKNNITENRLILSVYPNPASQSMTIQSADHLDGNLTIIGIDGKIYQSFRINGQQQQIDISKLPDGMYIAVYQGNQDLANQRFIIQK